MRKIKIYACCLAICFTASKTCKAQIILPTLQGISNVPLKITTSSISQITSTSAVGTIVISASLNNATSNGICWSTSAVPTTSNNLATYVSPLKYSISGLTANTNYFARSYAVYGGGTIYGNIIAYKTAKNGNTTGDDKLNYVTMATPGGVYSNNEVEFDSQIQPGYANIIQSGIAAASVIIDFSSYATLTSNSITVTPGGDKFSIAATGFFIPSETGSYTFTCEGDDAVDVFINGQNVANHYGGHPISNLGTHTGTISLTANVKYSFRARIQEFFGGEGLRVFWKKPSQNAGATWYQNTGEISSF